jgi:molybdopterin-guanine dinucleotide biosynthesis protein A
VSTARMKSGKGERPDAVVLAGGGSRRMGGDKALLRLPDGRSALEAVLAAAQQGAGRVFLSVDTMEHGLQLARPLSAPPLIVPDTAPGQGPLAALAGAMHATNARGLLVLAVDSPLVLPGVLEILYQAWLEAGQCEDGIAAPVVGGVLQPLPACYATALAPVADRLLAAGARSLRAFLQCSDVRLCRVPEAALRHADPSLRSCAGANTPGEWQDLIARVAQPGPGE